MSEATASVLTAPAVGAAARPPTRRPISRRVAESLTGYAFAGPNLILLGIFLFWPLILAAVLSFQNFSGFGTATFVGLGNYAELVADPAFWTSLINTTVFTAATLLGSVGLGLGLAMLLNSPLPGRAIFRTVIYVPMVVSGVASGLIGVLLFDENTGFIDKALQAAGLSGIPWQSNGTAAMAAVILIRTVPTSTTPGRRSCG